MIEQAEEVLAYRFENAELLREALTHASLADSRLESNERMEFLGDAILGYVVCEYLYDQYPDLLEGDLTKIKSTVVSRRTCAKISRQIGLADLLILGKGMIGRPSLPHSVAAAAIESIIAAIYLDGGLEAARAFIIEKFAGVIETASGSSHHQNFKSLLQQHAQQSGGGHPAYLVLDEKGPDHAKCFEVCVELNSKRFDSSWANSKKEAEQQAALIALTAMGVVEHAEDGSIDLCETVESDV